MEQTLKITNVLSDPTRYSIFEYITKKHDNVTVQEIAEKFQIHPNVARLHLSKLEDIEIIKSENRKTGKGGRPCRIYHLSDEAIELNFPSRDFRLLAKIAIEAMVSLGKDAEHALYETGKRYGFEIINQHLAKQSLTKNQLTFQQKINILQSTMDMLGFYPEIYIKEENQKFFFQIFNCPFREIAKEHKTLTCNMHIAFMRGLIEALFDQFELTHVQNLLDGCDSCAYNVNITN